MADETLTFNIEARDLASRTVNKVTAEVGGLTGAFQKMTKSVAVGTLAGNLMTKGAELLGEGLRNVVNYVGDSIQAASDLSESQNKVNVVFGESVGIVNKFAETSASAAGISKQAALESAGAFGNMFKTVGLADEQSAQFSTTLVQLAADMASFNNEDPSEMLDKLRSGLAGEAEPLRRFGVLLSEATVKTYAYENGIAEAGATLTEAQKVQARYGLILEQTGVQQGDFARTSDGLANTQRQLNAEMANLSTEIGEVLLPIALEFAHILVNDVVPALRDVFGALKTIGDWISAKPPGTFFGLDIADMAANIHNFGVDVANTLGASMEHVSAAEQRAHQAANGVKRELGDMFPKGNEVEASASSFMDASEEVFATVNAAARQAASELPHDYAAALTNSLPDLRDGLDELKKLMKNSLSDGQKIARLEGILSSDALARGLHDKRYDVRAAARALRNDTQRELEQIKSGAADAAADGGKAFAEWLGKQKRAAQIQARALAEAMTDTLARAGVLGAKEAGRSLANEYINGAAEGIRAGVGVIGDALYYLKVNSIGGSLPRSGPMTGDRVRAGAESIAKTFTDSLGAGIRGGVSTMGMPALGLAATGAGASYGGGGGGGGLTVVIQSTFPPKPSDARELARALLPAFERERKRQRG